MDVRRQRLLDIVVEMQPMTVRQAFYQASVCGLVEKSEAGYSKVQRTLVDLRREGDLPYIWIADNTRWQRKATSYAGPREAVRTVAAHYRKALWADAEEYVEIWLEKDALASVVLDVTVENDVPLMVSRGYASISFLHEAAALINDIGKPTFIYHLGDFDPSGQNAADKIEETLRRFAEVPIHFKRLAVLPDQIVKWSLPTRPTKKSDTRAKGFGDISVELDAIAPGTLRALVQDAIEKHLPRARFRVLKAAEETEGRLLQFWADQIAGEGAGE